MFYNNDRNESFIAITVGLVSVFLVIKPITAAFSSKRRPNRHKMPTQLVTATDVFTPKELTTITTCFSESEPDGKFLKDRHGFTHYAIDGQIEHPMVCLCHGLGTSMKAFQSISEDLVNAGYSVLKYDYYGHGYSKYDEKNSKERFFDYTPEMMVDQLEDLVSHVEKEEGGKPLAALCGHSTGGIVCVAANDRWSKEESSRSIVPKLVLISPAFYAKKPVIARIVDKFPRLFTSVFKNATPLQFLIGDSYLEAGEIAFAKDPETKKTIYADEEKQKTDEDIVLLKSHPFLPPSIFSINCSTLRGDLLEGHRDLMQNVLKDTKSEFLWLWGKLDRTVPYEENIAEVMKWAGQFSTLKVSALDSLGHESPFENPKKISSEIVSYLK